MDGSEPAPVLYAAAKSTAKSWKNMHGDAVSIEEVSEVLDLLVQAVTNQAMSGPIDPRLRSVLGRRLLELLRAEVVRDWCDHPDKVQLDTIAAVLGGLEAVRSAAEPNWDQHFSSRLAGPDGLALVVEVAHDLRSPLTSILFLAETLQRGQSGDVNELQRRQLGLVYSAALGLSTVTSNVIELARGGSQLADTQPAPFSVTEILESVHDIVRPMAEEKGITIRLLPPASDHREGHPHALSRVLLNLTTNALKFTEEGFVEAVAREKDLSTVEFSVRDTGPGINPQALETLYLPFRRSRDDRYAFSGTGLGLALSRRLVEAMGSELKVETSKDWGTRFFFDLALKAVE
jgi:signal transduction histidine kinase